MSSEGVHIACAVDSAMFVPVLGMLVSVERHDPRATVHLMHHGLTPEDEAALARFVAGSTLCIRRYAAEVDVSDMAIGSVYPSSVLHRLELFDRIPMSRCVYLDADTMVRSSLLGLMVLDLNGHPIAGVIDEPLRWTGTVWFRDVHVPVGAYFADVLGMTSETYINTGVMVVDLDRWRADGLTRKVIAACRATPDLVFPDQDGLNAALDGDLLPLPCEWNAFAYLEAHLWPEETKAPVRSTIRRWRKARIVHFVWMSRPWEPGHHATRYDAEFWKGVDRTFVGPILRARFAARSSFVPSGYPNRALAPSRRARIAYGKAMRDSIRGKRVKTQKELTTTVKTLWLGEFLCTIARAFGGKGVWKTTHLYGAAIIRNAQGDVVV